MKADGHTGKDIAKHRGASRATLYRYLTEGQRQRSLCPTVSLATRPAGAYRRAA